MVIITRLFVVRILKRICHDPGTPARLTKRSYYERPVPTISSTIIPFEITTYRRACEYVHHRRTRVDTVLPSGKRRTDGRPRVARMLSHDGRARVRFVKRNESISRARLRHARRDRTSFFVYVTRQQLSTDVVGSLLVCRTVLERPNGHIGYTRPNMHTGRNRGRFSVREFIFDVLLTIVSGDG